MTRVLDRLFVGDFKDASDLARVNSDAITNVITLCEERVVRRDRHIIYLHYPVNDGRPISASWLETILQAIENCVATGPTLLHCRAGLSRTPTLAAAYLVRSGFGTFAEALAYLERIRPGIGPSPVLLESVIRQLRVPRR